jgi:type IV pilus assembly protein PilC
MQFQYTVRTKQGEVQSGIVEANNEQSAIEALQARGLFILNLTFAESGPILARKIKIFQRVRQKDIVGFARQFSTLVGAQVPLLLCLQALAKQATNATLRDVLFEVAGDVEGGMLLSKALANHPKVFSDFFISMIKAGEVSGNLSPTLNYMADYLEKQYYLASRIRGAMMYPAFILGAFIVIAVLMMILVVPKLTAFLTESGQELPFVTKMIIAISGFLSSWWWLLGGLIVAFVIWLRYSLKHNAKVRYLWDAGKLKVPILGKRVFQKLYLTRIAENLSTLITGGISILRALQVTADVVGNVVFQNIIIEAQEEVRVGNQLSASLARHKEIPALVPQIISTGEQTGSMDIVLKKLAEFYTKEIDATVADLSSLIEPILIVFIGIGVALLVASILMPIYNLGGAM